MWRYSPRNFVRSKCLLIIIKKRWRMIMKCSFFFCNLNWIRFDKIIFELACPVIFIQTYFSNFRYIWKVCRLRSINTIQRIFERNYLQQNQKYVYFSIFFKIGWKESSIRIGTSTSLIIFLISLLKYEFMFFTSLTICRNRFFTRSWSFHDTRFSK